MADAPDLTDDRLCGPFDVGGNAVDRLVQDPRYKRVMDSAAALLEECTVVVGQVSALISIITPRKVGDMPLATRPKE